MDQHQSCPVQSESNQHARAARDPAHHRHGHTIRQDKLNTSKSSQTPDLLSYPVIKT